MKRINKLIKHFKMMGYDVNTLDELECVVVYLKTSSGYRVNRRVTFDELHEDFAIEKVVRDLNEMLIKDLYLNK